MSSTNNMNTSVLRSVTCVIVLCGILLLGAFFACNHWNDLSEAEAKRFCEGLMPRIEERKQATGKFPEKLDPSWTQGAKIPRLIHEQAFYAAHEEYYDFHFRNPRRLNSLFVYNSKLKAWLNGD